MALEAGSEPAAEGLIDPDPYTVVSCWIAAAALVLQFVELVRNRPAPPATTPGIGPHTGLLEQLENSLEDVERSFDLVTRAIERGSDNPETEFFGARFGVGQATLHLDGPRHQAFTSQLADSFVRLAALSRWSNHVIGQQPGAASILGRAILTDLEGSSERLNGLIRLGADNRALMAESRMIFATLRMAIAALLSAQKN